MILRLKANPILQNKTKITCPPSWPSPPPAAFSLPPDGDGANWNVYLCYFSLLSNYKLIPALSACSSTWPVFYFLHWTLQDSLNGKITTIVLQLQHIPKDKDYFMKSLLASMFAGEFSFGSEMTVCRALEEKCEIRSCSYLINGALTSEE